MIEPSKKNVWVIQSPSRSVTCNTSLGAGWWARKLKRVNKPLRIFYFGTECKNFDVNTADYTIADDLMREVRQRKLGPDYVAPRHSPKDHIPVAVRKIRD